jgi:hypothetical protein
VNGAEIGMRPQADGNYQVTYNRQPLYLYDREVMRLSANDHLVTTGSQGNGIEERGPGGVMLAVDMTK